MEPVRTAETDQWLDELTRSEGRDDPYPRYAALRQAAPVALAPDGAIVLTRYADCQAVIRDPAFGLDGEAQLEAIGLPHWRDIPAIHTLNSSLLSINPPEHTRLRRLVSKAFTARRVEQLRASVGALVDLLLDGLEGGGDFVGAFAFPLPVAVIGELLGVPEADRAQFQPLVRDWTMILDTFDLDVLHRANLAATRMRDYLGDLAEQRRREPQDDLISAMVALEGESLTHDELVTMAALLFSAGFETTTHLLGNGLVALLEHPDQARALGKDDGLVPSAIEELLRFDSPVQLTSRTALADTEVAGVPVPAGAHVVCYLGAANRDPGQFDDPDRLDLARRAGGPLSFGAGAHYCLGAPLARLEAQLAVPALLRRYPELALAGGAVRRDSLTLRGYLSLPVAC